MIINPERSETQPSIDKKQAEVQIRAMLQYMHTMGAVSNESSDIQKILEQLKDDSVTPEGAVEMARQVEMSRQENYH